MSESRRPRIRRVRDPLRHRVLVPAPAPAAPKRHVTVARVTPTRVSGDTGRVICAGSWDAAIDSAVSAVLSRKPNGQRMYISAVAESTRRVRRTGLPRALSVRQVARRDARALVAAATARRDALLRHGHTRDCQSWHGDAATCSQCSALPASSPAPALPVTRASRLADSTLLRFVTALRSTPPHASVWDTVPAPPRSLGATVAPLSPRDSDAIDRALAAESSEYRALLAAKRARQNRSDS